jgi:hypothetical protein
MFLRPDLPPGRGLIGGRHVLEFQTALPVKGVSDEEQSFYLDNLISHMSFAWTNLTRPPRIRVLPSYLTIDDLDEEINQLETKESAIEQPIGLNREIRPVGFSLENDGPSFLVTSAVPNQGKTTFIHTWISLLADKIPPTKLKIFLIDFHTHSLRKLGKLPHVKKDWFISRQNQLEPALIQLQSEIVRRSSLLEKNYQNDPENFTSAQFLQDEGFILILIDDYNRFRLKTPQRDLLYNCIILGEECGVRLIISDTSSSLGYPGSDDILNNIKKNSCGISFGGADSLDTYYDQAKVSAGEKAKDFPTGRGYFINQGFCHLVQLATHTPIREDQNEILNRIILKIVDKYNKN